MIRRIFSLFGEGEQGAVFSPLTKKYDPKIIKKKENKLESNLEELSKRVEKLNDLIEKYIEFVNKYFCFEQKLNKKASFFFIEEESIYIYANHKIDRNYKKLINLIKKLKVEEDFLIEYLNKSFLNKKKILNKVEDFDLFFELYQKKQEIEKKKIEEGLLPQGSISLCEEEFDEIKEFACKLEKNQGLLSKQKSSYSLKSSTASLIEKKSKKKKIHKKKC